MSTTFASVPSRRPLGFCAAFFLAVLLGFAFLAASARAGGSTEFTSLTAGVSDLQAGAHADANLSFDLATTAAEGPMGEPGGGCFTGDGHCEVVKGGAPKDVVTELPRGLVGNPLAAPTCTATELSAEACNAATQVGTTTITVLVGGVVTDSALLGARFPVFNMVPSRGEVAKLGFRLFANVNAFVSLKLRGDGDYGVTATSFNINDTLPLVGAKMTIWGVPMDPSHDELRTCNGQFLSSGCTIRGIAKPFLSNPSECGVNGSATVSVDTYQRPGQFVSASSEPQQMEGCEKESFNPSLEVTPTTNRPETPTGLDVNLSFPQTWESPSGLNTPPLREARVTLPEGMTINPASADGLQSCSDTQLGLGSESPVSCPDAAKLGTAVAETPVLAKPMEGSVYLRPQASGDPASGQMFRLALVLEDQERGLLIKLPGEIKANPKTGQLETVFRETPELPVESVSLRFKGGARAPLVTPPSCGTETTTAQLSSWGGQQASLASSFTIACAAASKFNPGFEAGTASPAGGQFSPFTLRVTREDGQPNVSSLQTTLPEGLLAKLAGVPLCPEAEASSGNCPAASQVGAVTVGAGAGSNPLYVPQPGKSPTALYLAGPYRGAPYSLIATVPAQAGPFDLGTVAVRNAIEINPETAQVSVQSDPLPQILEGVPVSYRDIRVEVNRGDFTLNPTSCDPMEVMGQIGSTQGRSADVSDRFQAASCERLSFKPTLALSVRGATHRSAHPAFKAVLSMPKQAGANVARAQVTLPKTEFLENAHIRTVCTRVQFAADQCPAASVYGRAKAFTPLLEYPLEGPVYLRSSNHQLPDLVAALKGPGANPVEIDLDGRIDSVDARIRNTFELVPDAPVTRFVLEMQGGGKGLLVNNTELCKTTPRASVRLDGQNGKVADSSPVMRADCGGKGRKARRGR